MAPLGALPALLASLLLAATDSTATAEGGEAFSASTFVPAPKQFETVYSSTQSSAGFMFKVKAKTDMMVYGLDVNVVDPSLFPVGPQARVVVYTKEGSFDGYESDEGSWDVWMDASIESYGMDGPTPLPQRAEDAAAPLFVPAQGRRSFYVAFEGPHLRYSNDPDRLYYQNEDVVIYGRGASKRMDWGGSTLSPRTFNGGLHYYAGDEASGPHDVGLLPGNVASVSPTTGPTKRPTESPTISVVPSVSSVPTEEPTRAPTGSPTSEPTRVPTTNPTIGPTRQPTASPTSIKTFSTNFEGAESKPALVYAGIMFDLKGRDDIEIQTIAVNTYITGPLDVRLYVREGGYAGAEKDIDEWTHRADVTVSGRGMGEPTYLPVGSFEPILLRRGKRMGFYVATDGPYLRATKGEAEGKAHADNPDVVIYEGVGKRDPITAGTISPRIFNGAFGYKEVYVPTPSPTIDTRGLFVRDATFAPVEDTYIQRGERTAFGKKAQLKVDGSPESVALMKFDVSVLNGDTDNEPTQILSAVLRLYSMTGSDFGGAVSIVPGGDVDGDATTWDDSPYATRETGTPVGEFRSVWPDKFYEMDVTRALRGGGSVPRTFLVRISSDRGNGVMYRSTDGASPNGPLLTVKFAYDPNTNEALARSFGSDPPTPKPTFKPTTPEWDNPRTPANPSRKYFNYNPRSNYGPDKWYRATPDGYHANLKKLKTNVWRNECKDGRRQSPRDMCRTNDKCSEYHEIRQRRGQYGLGARNETKARPTPYIMHNKLRLSYRERRSEFDEPIPPGADFALNGLNSGTQDLVHIDLKVRSEHRLCGKQYDAEMQQYYLHQYGNLEAISILINADGEEPNAHFQILLNFFQSKFDVDKRLCGRKQQRARALFSDGRNRRDSKERVEDTVPQQSYKQLRGDATSTSENDSMTMDDNKAKEEFKDDDDESSESSLGSILYQNIRSRFLRLIHRRAKELRWAPLQPGDILKSVHFWAYSGSTTEPPCFEDVKWRIIDVPMTISPVQYIQLKKLMFNHVDPTTCSKTSTHYDESNARPVQPYRGGATYRCKRSDYASDMEREASGKRKGFVLPENWWGVDNLPWVEPEFPRV